MGCSMLRHPAPHRESGASEALFRLILAFRITGCALSKAGEHAASTVLLAMAPLSRRLLIAHGINDR